MFLLSFYYIRYRQWVSRLKLFGLNSVLNLFIQNFTKKFALYNEYANLYNEFIQFIQFIQWRTYANLYNEFEF